MELKIKQEKLPTHFNLEHDLSSDYFNVFVSKKAGIMIAQILSSYVPTEHFIHTFQKMGDIIVNQKLKKFIFDKRELRAFNQPTMEWYYIEWKEKLFDHGLSQHRKLLPNEDWFKKCVEAGKDEILKDYPNNRLSEIDIQYFDTLTDCINF